MGNVVAFVSVLRQGDVETVRRMIEQGEADANAMVEITLTELYPHVSNDRSASVSALHAATVFGRLDVVQLLLEKNAHVNTRTDTFRRETPLMLALEHSFFQVADALLRGGADPNLGSDDHTSVLGRCCCASRAHFIPTLLRYGAHIEGDEHTWETPLHLSVRRNEALCCELLLSNNANIEAAICFSRSAPLHLAVCSDRFEIVCLLLTHQRSRRGGHGVASLLLRTYDYDQNVLHCARSAKTARFLVEQCRGEDDGSLLAACHQLMFARDYRGRTPLEAARIHSRADVAEYLESFTNLTLATSAAASDDCMAVMLNPELDDFQRVIATECLDLVCTTCLDVSDAALYAMLGYLSPSDVMKR